MADKTPTPAAPSTNPPGLPVELPRAGEQCVFHGACGGPFAIYGDVGERAPSVTIGGRLVAPTAWNTHSIKGTVPADLHGEVDVTFNGVTIKGRV